MNDELRIIVDLWHEKSTIITMFVTLIGYQILILFYLIYWSSVNIDFFRIYERPYHALHLVALS